MNQLGRNTDLRYVGAAVGNANNTDSNSTRIDTANCEGVIFLTTITDCAATGVATLKIEQNNVDSDSGMAALTGASAAATCAINDDLNGKLLVASVHRPRERYVQAVRTSATANIAFGECLAIVYGVRELPAAAHSTVQTAVHTVSPAEV